MSDAPVVHIGENSPEQVAYRLMHHISLIENRDLSGGGNTPADREWILRTFDQCRSVVNAGASINKILERFPV